MVSTRSQVKAGRDASLSSLEPSSTGSVHRVTKRSKSTATQRAAPKSTQKPLRQPLSFERFGLIQERYTHSLYALVIQAILWNQTAGRAARPVLEAILERYPEPKALADANQSDLVDLLYPIGLHNQRAARLIKLGQAWVAAPPCKERRYVRRDYPNKGDGRDAKQGEALAEDDGRKGWEIAHLPGMGPYALDSYRMFYRDKLRGVEGVDGVEPEWKRVRAGDKDLKAWLIWRWAKDGSEYDAERRRVVGKLG